MCFLRSKGGRCVGQTLPNSCTDYLEILCTSNTWSPPEGLSRDRLTLPSAYKQDTSTCKEQTPKFRAHVIYKSPLLHFLDTPALRITVIFSQNHPSYGPSMFQPADITGTTTKTRTFPLNVHYRALTAFIIFASSLSLLKP